MLILLSQFKRRVFSLKKIMFFVILLLAFAVSGFAEISGLDLMSNKDMIKVGGNVAVGKNDIVKSAISVNGNVSVDGFVKEDAVAIGGDIVLGKKAKVVGDAISIGGKIVKEKGAVLIGDEVEISLGKATCMVPLITYQNIALLGTTFKLLSFFSVLLIAIIAIKLFPNRVGKISYFAERFPIKAIFLGLLAIILAISFILVLLLSMVGMVFIPLYVLFLIALVFLGHISVAQLAGKKFLAKFKKYNRPMAFELLVGILFLMAISMIPLIGKLVTPIVILMGLGSVLATRIGES